MTERKAAHTIPATEGPGGFGGRLLLLRRKRGMTLAQLGKAIRCAPSAIGAWEMRERFPSYWNLIEIAHFFNADIAWLTGMQSGTNDGGLK